METKTKVVIGVGVVVVVVAVGAVVYFKVIKPKKILKEAQKAAEEAAKLAQSQGKTEQEVRKAAEAAAKNSAQSNNVSTEDVAKIVTVATIPTVPTMAKGTMQEETKPSNIAIATNINNVIKGINLPSWMGGKTESQLAKETNALLNASDNDFRQVYNYYKNNFKENIIVALGSEANVSANMIAKLSLRAAKIGFKIK